ncbi:MAG: DUF349 domain-containing protein [Bacteroidales bacterium]
MNTKDHNGPAPEEQSGDKSRNTGNTENNKNMEKSLKPEDLEERSEAETEDSNNAGATEDTGREKENSDLLPDREATQSGSEKTESSDDDPDNGSGTRETESGEKETPAGKTIIGTGKPEAGVTDAEQQPGKEDNVRGTGDVATGDVKASPGTGDVAAGGDKGVPANNPAGYHDLDKEELLQELEKLLEAKPAPTIREDVEAIKVSFYKRHKTELEQKRKKFMQEGGDAEDFEPGEDPREIRFKELYRKYRHSKAAHNRSLEHSRQANLEEKLKVIEDLKELVSNTEDINRTFPEFRKLQKRWHEIGMVPQQNLKDLWDTYHHYVETFYDHIKINKDLRDLDLKKNLETKIGLCEKAEELLLEPNVINAFRNLQKLHDQWRETGPVPRDQKDVIWERFREVTHQINKKHQEHFDKLKESQKKNLETKTALCEKAEAINEKPMDNFQQVEKLTKDMIGLQKTWKTIGFAPKKDNTKIYQRFRNVCDRFFARKREFNAQNKEYLNENLQKKLDLCVQAEALKESTDWKSATDELISLQKKWKEIGPVPRKHYDPVWKRFRAACDHFFNRKSEFFSDIDAKYEENLKKKLDIIDKIENFKFGDDLDTSLNALKEYQREWVSIGFVPIKEKDRIQKRYRAALDKHFEGLKVDESKKNLMKFRTKLEGVKEKPRAFNKMKFDREKFLNRYKQLENDITLWENNIGFFAKSKSAEATIKEFRDKIEQGKKQMELLEEKIRMIDEMDPE